MPAPLAAALRSRFAEALASGDLHPIETELCEIEDGGVRFAVRRVKGADRKRGPGAKPAASNPFLPYDEALHVADLGDDHVCLLNKFPVVRDHAVVVTRAFADQEEPLEAGDLAALWTLLAATGGVGFFNAGAIAGASQRHRHLQVVPAPLAPGFADTPVDPLIETARFDDALGRVPGFPFLHAVAKLRSLQRTSVSEAAHALHGMVQEMARAFGCDRPGRPYNLVITREWLLFVPRSRETWEGVSLNGLAFAGALLVRAPEALDRLRAAGPMAALRHAGVALR